MGSVAVGMDSGFVKETEGKDYYFVNKKKFDDLVKSNAFYEYAKVFNNYYGTLRDPVIQNLSKGKDVLFDIDWQGSAQLKKQKTKNKLVSIFILPPDIQVLRDRLSNRATDDKLTIEERMGQFKSDVLHWKEYDYVVINEDLEKCYNEIKSIIDCEKISKKFTYNQERIKKKITELVN